MERLLEVRGLQTYFFLRSDIAKAVDGVSFWMTPGEMVGLVGESGSGKSVTVLSILRLIQPPGRIVSGEMVWLSLTFDHRLVDGAPAARFLQRVVRLTALPELLLE